MKLRFSLITLTISFFLVNAAKAQSDSTHYDLGRLEVNKNFTQSITVKASDIERYQFNNITDALNVFFYGTFTNDATVVYVIDGNIVNDVDAYNIQDIEEITLVQSALGQVNGAAPSQQMILIKTRRGGEGKQGIVTSNQTSFVDARNNNNYPNALKPSGLYEQAYVGAYKNYDGADIGFSANYLHDVSPEDLSSSFTAFDPFHYNRFRLNGFTDTRLWKGTTLSFGVNYTPEVNNESYTGDNSTPNSQLISEGKMHESQHLFNTDIKLHSHITGGLSNTLSAAYNHYNDFENGAYAQTVVGPGSFERVNYTLQSWRQQSHALLLKDNLTWHQQAGDWSIDPSVNFMYRHLSDTLGLVDALYQDSILNNGSATYVSSQKANYNLSLLSPSVDIYYKNIFDIQAGFTYILNKENIGPVLTVNHLLPFISTSINISELARLQTIKLQVFGSFARENEFLNDPYVSLDAFTLQGFTNASGNYSTAPYPIVPTAFNDLQAYNNYEAGFVLGLWKDLSVSYTFRENYYWIYAPYAILVYGGSTEIEDAPQNVRAATHSIALNYDFHTGSFNWATGLTVTTSKLQLTGQGNDPANAYLGNGHRWTGGFVNRFTYNGIFAGFNLLYQVGQRPYGLQNWVSIYPTNVPSSNTDSFALQSLYFGTKLRIQHLKYAEVYLDARNILQNKPSDITDERRFYGFGVKVNL